MANFQRFLSHGQHSMSQISDMSTLVSLHMSRFRDILVLSRFRDNQLLSKEVQALKGITIAIREKITAHGLSQAETARALGIGRQTFSRKLNGHVDFSLSELTRLAEVFNTTVSDLMQRADQIAYADVAPSANGYAIKDKRDDVVILQARHADFGGEAA